MLQYGDSGGVGYRDESEGIESDIGPFKLHKRRWKLDKELSSSLDGIVITPGSNYSCPEAVGVAYVMRCRRSDFLDAMHYQYPNGVK